MDEHLLNAVNTLNITMCRVYDVLLAGLSPELRRQIEEIHSKGTLIGSPPLINENPFGLEDE